MPFPSDEVMLSVATQAEPLVRASALELPNVACLAVVRFRLTTAAVSPSFAGSSLFFFLTLRHVSVQRPSETLYTMLACCTGYVLTINAAATSAHWG